MKIGIVCYPTYGGSGVLATELGIGLAALGHEIHFISYRRPARLNNYYKDVYFHEVNAFEYPLFEHAPYDSSLTSKIVDVVQHESLDLLHVHYAIPHAAVAYMAKEILKTKGIYMPFITTLHGTDITLVGQDRSLASVVEFSINKSDIVTSVSDSLRKQTMDYFNIQKDIAVVHNFIDLEKFKRKPNKEYRRALAPNDEKIIVHTSNFRKLKRVDDVVYIFKGILEKIDARLLLVGDGPLRQNIEGLCRKLKLCDKIQFLGKQDAVDEVLSLGDLFLLPSEKESFGLSALEAMACGVPVVSSNAGGLPEVNEHGITGFLSDVGNIEDMTRHAVYILEDESRLELFRKNARKKANTFSKAN
ncbi:MAG: N-acetyl-alpha-D-glucosaminyl L-malate synthase BshA, partial [Saprospiraceae bacterium]|nr:N-acetyl-alpha-D-glucosaminyl L-malate synthase BshA [Saprospiraceae bacterium]